MAPWLQLAALPSSLLFLIFASVPPAVSQDLNLRWPYNLPADSKYYPEDEVLVKRDQDIQQILQTASPTGVRKLSGDAGEKFYLDYWGFEEEQEKAWDRFAGWTNVTMWTSFDLPVRIHSTHDRLSPLSRRFSAWSMLEKRAFSCPAGTSACTSINRPNSCCASGYTCQIVEETNSEDGDVGCCPSGQTCGNALSDTCASGYTGCPNNPGGGCCLPGYACFDVGCIQTNTATALTTPPGLSTTTVTSYTTITPFVSTPTTTPTTSSTTTSTSTPISSIAPVVPLISTVTLTMTVTSSATLSLTCSAGFRSCPASLGGGCCPTDRACGSANCPALTTSTQSSGTPEPPVRPTSLTTTIETTVTTATQSSSLSYPVTGCPTGFYACSAYYQGGCCQTGRNCDSTSCPAVASTTLISGSGLTVVAPTGSGITAPASLLTGNCASGWMTCAPGVGGGCCPSGYVCGSVSCNIPPGATSSLGVGSGGQVGKEAPTNAASSFRADGFLAVSWKVLAALLVVGALL